MATSSILDEQNRGMNRAAAAITVLLVGVVVYLGNAGFPGLLDDADASHAMGSWEMLQRHDAVILYMNGIRYLMKAPLHYWAVAVSYGIFGRNEFATRLPVALSMIGLAALVNAFARRYFGVRAGLYGGLAMLTRGLVGVIFPVAILGLFVIVTRGWRRLGELRLVSSSLVFLSIAAPWHVLASLQAKTFFWSYFINEHFKRAVGTRYPPDYEAVPLWLWLGAHLIWLFPWSIFLVAAFRGVGRPSTWKNLATEQQARLLLVLWSGFILLFFSLTFGSRMEYYSFGAWPAIAMLLGIGLAKAEEEGKRWLSWIQGALALVGIVIAVVLITLIAKSANVHVTGDISTLLTQHENDFYRVSMAHILDLTPQAFAVLRLPAALAAIAFLVGLSVAWWLRRTRRHLAATLTMAATMALFFFAANIALGVFGPYLSSKPLVDKVSTQISPSDAVAIYGEFDASSSVAFYTGRKLLIWNGRYNNLEAGSYYPDAPQIFLTDADFLSNWRRPNRILLFVPSEKRHDADIRLAPVSVCIIAESGGKAVYSNRPSPGQELDCLKAKD